MIRIHFPSEESPERPSYAVPERPTTDESLSGVAALPFLSEAALVRHGARVLRPSEAAVLNGQAPLRPTVYLQDTMLVPEDLLRSDDWSPLNAAIEHLGVRMVNPPSVADSLGIDERLADTDAFRELPRSVRIEVTGGARTVDAWTVLQTLRAAAAAGNEPLRTATERITLEHLMVGSALDGAGGVVFEGVNVATHGSPDLSGLFDRPTVGTSGRIPVTVALAEPPRPAPAAGRRPVVAVLDTGLPDPVHPWLPATEQAAADQDSIVIFDTPGQDAIRRAATDQKTGVVTRQPIVGELDVPVIGDPLLGELSSHTGHGTFIAGLIRQLAPTAQIYALRVMHPDGFAHEGDVLAALAWIGAHVRTGQQVVDVVSLSLGYFHETDEERLVTSRLQPWLTTLTDAGVTVVAAAGNFSSSRPFFPAALAAAATSNGSAPLISVGALNPNSSTARFSNEGPWVTCYASGVAMVSTFPPVAGELSPGVRGVRRETYDGDDFRSGFAVWSGTSFAAPAVAACIADRLTSAAGAAGLANGVPAGAAVARQALEDVRNDPAIAVSGPGEPQP